jgi:hypothetical protein
MKYRKLPGHRRGLLHSASLWLGDDHILSVRGFRVREEYKRYHFRDIQGIVIADAPRYHISTRTLTIAAVWFIAYIAAVARTSWAHVVFWLIFAGLAVAWLYVSGASSCRCRIFTAVSREDLPSIYRTWTARRFLQQLEPHILQAQGALPENWVEIVEARVIGPPELAAPVQSPGFTAAAPGFTAAAPAEAPRKPARARTPITDVFVVSLLADAIVLALTLGLDARRIQWAIYGLAFAKMLTAVLVLVQHYRGGLQAGMQRLAILSLISMGLLFYLRPLFMGMEMGMQPTAAGRAAVATSRDALAIMGFSSALRQVDAIVNGILGLIGGFLTVRAAGREPDAL